MVVGNFGEGLESGICRQMWKGWIELIVIMVEIPCV